MTDNIETDSLSNDSDNEEQTVGFDFNLTDNINKDPIEAEAVVLPDHLRCCSHIEFGGYN